MNRIEHRFETLRREGRKALIPFLTAGDPSPDFTVPALHRLVEAGADIVELGVPFSDPMADGPTIQRSSERALRHHTSLDRVLTMVARFRESDRETPLVLMGYLNPVEAMGYERFISRAEAAGVDGLLLVDLPPEEAGALLPLLERAGIDPIFLVAPTTRRERIAEIGRLGRGYLYYVSLKGVTGADHLDLGEVRAKVAEIKTLVSLPVVVGFGVKDAETASQIAELADGVVVGTALVREIERSPEHPETALDRMVRLLRSMREAIDRIPQSPS